MSKLSIFFCPLCSFINTSIISKWAALQWLSCFLIPSTSNVSSHTMLSMSWGASTVRVRQEVMSVVYNPLSFLLICWSFLLLKLYCRKGLCLHIWCCWFLWACGIQCPRFWCNSHHTLLGQPTEIPKPSFAACCGMLLKLLVLWLICAFILHIWMSNDKCRMQLLHFQS